MTTLFTTSSLPFGYFNGDTSFVSSVDSFTKWVYMRLGCNVTKAEITPQQIWMSYEEAWIVANRIINEYQAKNTLNTLLGTVILTSSTLDNYSGLGGAENKYPHQTLNLQKRTNEAYSYASSYKTTSDKWQIHSASIAVVANQQQYDLGAMLSSSTGGQNFDITEVWYYSPYNIKTNYFYDYASYQQYDLKAEELGMYEINSRHAIHYVMPIWEDVLQAQLMKTNALIRKSHYGYELIGKTLKLYPTPSKSFYLWISYKLPEDPLTTTIAGLQDNTVNGVANLSNVPFGFIQPSNLNQIIWSWVQEYGLALSKEIMGQIRSKYQSIPIPNATVTLNGSALISEAREEKKMLIEELTKKLEETTYSALHEQEAKNADNVVKVNAKKPLFIIKG